MSDHVAFGLLVYTGLQIALTTLVLKTNHSSILPYFALILLVFAVIPACRLFEARWSELDDAQAADPALESLFKRDRALVWLSALGLPFALTGLFKGLAFLFA
ncbi:hypothetical protein [Alteraurantiacibacter aquimixticola]|nr:hypothetical protein [Alteraurantiacibacter aquimixticola]